MDLTLNNLQRLIYHKTQAANEKCVENDFFYKKELERILL